MKLDSPLWREITPSQYPWERDALAYIREALPDHEPYRAWACFEFVAEDGAIGEVDLLVLAPKGFFLVEIKSWEGSVEGDANTWVRRQEGRETTLDSPLLLANRKAKKLVSLLKRQKSAADLDLPFLEPLVFLSHPNVSCKLTGTAKQGIVLRDREATPDQAARLGILAALVGPPAAGSQRPGRPKIDRPLAKAVSRAIEEAGVRRTQRARRVGDFVLDEVLYYGPNYQDWKAHHASLEAVRRRVRIYPAAIGAGPSERSALERAARRELELLEPVDHPGILKPLGFTQSELGPALVFDYQPEAQRLDHFLAQRGATLGFDVRLHLVRSIGETLQYAHDKRLFHRAVAPQSILVWNPGSAKPQPRLINWQTASREATTELARATLVGTSHLEPFMESAASAYLAPEIASSLDANPETLDVFSLGALAYFVFSGRAPAASAGDLLTHLAQGGGLQLAGALDGAHPQLCELIALATAPEVPKRIPSIADFLGYLEVVEAELAAPESTTIADPLEARKGDRLDGGFEVVSRLGKGSTALVLRVQRDGREEVLKIALEAAMDERLRAEAEVLRRLSSPLIVRLLDTTQVSGRQVLLLESAGEQTLAQRLRETGRLQLELLERFGDDLLGAVAYLEKEGVAHRDLKPDNLGVAKVGRAKELHLVLFDFSLAGVPATNLNAGTRPYLDPFLDGKKRRQWDLHAERYGAAVTLYEMATGTLPRWGDGVSHPRALRDEVTIESDLFDPAAREALTAFFRKALRREISERFDNAEEMQRGWRRAFEESERPATTTAEESLDELRIACAHARTDTPLALLHLSTRALNALERIQIYTVGSLRGLSPHYLSRLKGVGHKTRKELLEAMGLLAHLGPVISTVAPLETTTAVEDEPSVFGLDPLVRQLLPRTQRANAPGERHILEALFCLSESSPAHPMHWPNQTDVALVVGVTRARVSQVLVKSRERWKKNSSLTELRQEIASLLDARGGVAVAAELFPALLASRGSAAEEPLRTRFAAAALRAATEAEEAARVPRWTYRRRESRIFIASTEMDAEALLDFAERLGQRADDLAAIDPLPAPQRVLEALQALPKPPLAGIPITSERSLRLAAAASKSAALSSRLELYPRQLAADRALLLASSALLGARELTAREIQERVRSRYPEAQELPGRPELDALLQRTGLELQWNPNARNGEGAFSYPAQGELGASSSTSLVRQATTLAPQIPSAELTPEIVDAKLFEERLHQAAREGAFLALVVTPGELLNVERELARRFPVRPVSLEERWIAAMQDSAAEHKIDWSFVLASDALPPGGRDGQQLRRFAREALARVEAELSTCDQTILLSRAGLLARYGEVAFLDRLRARVERAPRAGERGLHGLWVLIAQDGDGHLPVLDGEPVPARPGAQTARVPAAWIANKHRAGGAAKSVGGGHGSISTTPTTGEATR